MTGASKSVVATGYDTVFGATSQSPTFRRLWREVALGGNFPEDFLHISFVTLDQHQRMTEALRVGPGDTLVDLGCGMAGPALLAARETGANLIGVDFSAVAVTLATERASRLGLSNARFVLGTFEDTGLDTASADAAMSEDAIQYSPDKAAAFKETARILRPGGRLVFTAFEIEPEHVKGLPIFDDDPVDDYRPPLVAAGFSIETYEEIPGWPEPLRNTCESLLDARDALVEEMGQNGAMALLAEPTLTLQRQIYRRRVLAIAVRA